MEKKMFSKIANRNIMRAVKQATALAGLPKFIDTDLMVQIMELSQRLADVLERATSRPVITETDPGFLYKLSKEEFKDLKEGKKSLNQILEERKDND